MTTMNGIDFDFSNYVVPRAEGFEILNEGILCASDPENGLQGDASSFDDYDTGDWGGN